MLTVGSLFTGIGGIDLGLERTGHFRTIWMSEIDTYANQVLAKHWPDVTNLGNIKEIDFERVERPDLIIGGYPCQPFSTAGKRQGENDPRHLWPECLRALRILRPRYALFENVRGHLAIGFSRVLADLAAIGFDAEWQIIPASAVGAPHRRDRLFIVAYPVGERLQRSERQIYKTRESRGLALRGGWQPEPDVGRVAHGVPARVDRLRALGNAVVPQVAEAIGYMIADHAYA